MASGFTEARLATMVEDRLFSDQHVILENGHHSGTQINLRRLSKLRNVRLRQGLLRAVAQRCVATKIDTLVIGEDDMGLFRGRVPDGMPSRLPTHKTDEGVSINHPSAREIIRRASGIAVFQSVTAGGESALEKFGSIWELNHEVPIGLGCLVKREALSEMPRALLEPKLCFEVVNYPLLSWPEEECRVCLRR